MTHERQHTHARSKNDTTTHDDDLAPGRSSRSNGLVAPERPIVSGLIQRKARDANGVAEGAEDALATAASSHGAPLPDPVMRKFESSLGADLSSVRVHTGSESAAAAHGVGARAYTTGQDIHFAAGQYDASSQGGEHLLAHEVAHTVQQRGGAPARQNKLEVSSPDDSFEHEADRAADAMLAGRPATISSASSLARKVVQRDQAGDMEAQGKEGEDDAQKDTLEIGQIPALAVSNISDRESAGRAIAQVNESQALLLEATRRGEPAEALTMWQQNNTVIGLLQTFADAANVQASATSNFQLMYARMVTDFARLNRIGTQYNGESLINAKDAKEAGDQADGKISAAGGSAKQMHAQLDKLKKANPRLAAQVDTLKRKDQLLAARGMDLTSDQAACQSTLSAVQGAVHTLDSALCHKASREMRAAFDKTKKESDETKAIIVGLVSAVAKSAVAAIKEGPAAGGGEAAKGVGEVVWEQVKQQAIKLNEKLNMEAGVFPAPKGDDVATATDDEAASQAVIGAMASLRGLRGGVMQALDKFFLHMDTFELEKAQYRADMIELGHALDDASKKAGGSKGASATGFSEMSVFLAEADTFLVQADMVYKVGKDELDVDNQKKDRVGNASAANVAHAALGAVNSGSGQRVWLAYKWTATKYSGLFNMKKETFEHIAARESTIDIKTGANTSTVFEGKNESQEFGSAETPMLGGKHGSNQIIGQSLDEVQKMKAKVAAFRAGIAAVVLG